MLYSLVQIRGSIPLFWTQWQNGLQAVIDIKRSEDMTSHVFKGHLEDMLEDYQKVIMINLVRKSKKEEDGLTLALVKLLHLQKEHERLRQNVRHIWYDFHEET